MAFLAPSHKRPGGKRLSTRVTAIIAVIGLIGATGSLPVAYAQRGAELDELKAAFVYQFANFVEWPESAFESPEAPLRICIIGNDTMKESLRKSVVGKLVNGHPVEIAEPENESEYPTCQIVFVDGSAPRTATNVVETVMTKPVLTVSDVENFTELGGVIRLYQQQSKLRIEINIDAAKRAELKISSKLLNLARVVHDS